MTRYEVKSISNWIRLLNQETEQESNASVFATTGQIVTVLHLITSKFDHEMAIIELGEEHVVVKWGTGDEIALEGDIINPDDELRFAVDDSSGPMPQVSREEDIIGFVVRLAD